MIYDASQLPSGHLSADLCVVGAGPGGLTVATLAAEAGLKVVVIEAGALVTPGQMNQREADMFPKLLWAAGGRETDDHGVRILQGKGVGGSSLHNLNLCKRIPAVIRAHWRDAHHLDALDEPTWAALYAEAEALLSVSPADPGLASRANMLLERGCEALGWAGAPLKHNRTGCVGSGYCEVGCSFDAKNNALKVFAPRLVKAGGTILTGAQVIRVMHRRGRAVGVEAQILARGGRLEVRASQICLSASATGSAAILIRSRVPDPSGRTGQGLHIHPAVAIAGEFDAPVHAWRGIPQTYECTEWIRFEPNARHRTWIVPAFGHPMGVSTLVPGHGAGHRAMMTRYPHLMALTAMLHDHTSGSVMPYGELGLQIRYRLNAADRAELKAGLTRCAQLLFAAGAQRIHLTGLTPLTLSRGDSLAPLDDVAVGVSGPGAQAALSAVHPMGSVAMGGDPRRATVGPDGRHHHLAGLWISDGALFPTSLGVPPQLSIYALGLHVGRALISAS